MPSLSKWSCHCSLLLLLLSFLFRGKPYSYGGFLCRYHCATVVASAPAHGAAHAATATATYKSKRSTVSMVKHMTRQVSLFTLLYHQNIRDSGNEQTKKHLRSGKRTNSKFSQTQNYKKTVKGQCRKRFLSCPAEGRPRHQRTRCSFHGLGVTVEEGLGFRA